MNHVSILKILTTWIHWSAMIIWNILKIDQFTYLFLDTPKIDIFQKLICHHILSCLKCIYQIKTILWNIFKIAKIFQWSDDIYKLTTTIIDTLAKHINRYHKKNHTPLYFGVIHGHQRIKWMGLPLWSSMGYMWAGEHQTLISYQVLANLLRNELGGGATEERC